MMRMKKMAGVVLGCGAALLTSPVFAVGAGDVLVRLGAAWVVPNDSSGSVQVGGVPIPGSEVGVSSSVSAGLTLSYLVTDNIGIGLLGAWPFLHDIKGKGTLSPLGTIGNTRQLPPTLTLQYHFLPQADIRPYIGIGFNYTAFFNTHSSSSLEAALGGPTSIKLQNSWGAAGEVGVDVTLVDDWFFNASVWYVGIGTKATLTTTTFTGCCVANISSTVNDVDINPWVFMVGFGRRF